MSAGRMMNYIQGKQVPSDEILDRIAKNLKLNSTELKHLESIIVEERYLRRGSQFSKRLTQEEFKEVSDWKTWSILTYFQSSDLSPSKENIGKKLGLSLADVDVSLKKLENVGLIGKKDKSYELLVKSVTTTHDIPSADLRRAHKEFINLAMTSLDIIPIHERDVSGISMCIDKEKIPELKKLIAEFRAKFTQLAEGGNAH